MDRHDTMRQIKVCSKADEMASLIQSKAQKRKIKKKTKNKNRVAQKKRSGVVCYLPWTAFTDYCPESGQQTDNKTEINQPVRD